MCREVCNAYTELNDPITQRARFEQQAKVNCFLFSSSLTEKNDCGRKYENINALEKHAEGQGIHK